MSKSEKSELGLVFDAKEAILEIAKSFDNNDNNYFITIHTGYWGFLYVIKNGMIRDIMNSLPENITVTVDMHLKEDKTSGDKQAACLRYEKMLPGPVCGYECQYVSAL